MPNLRARHLRWTMTETERKLWRLALSPPGRARPADFLCAKARLVVETDGALHTSDAQIAHDARRTRWLVKHGLRVVRFTNREVFEDAERVADAIYLAATAPVSTSMEKA